LELKLETTKSSLDKIIRKAARGLIGSTLSDEELENLAQALIFDSKFTFELSNSIAAFLNQKSNADEFPDNNFPSQWIDDLLSEIKRKRLSKAYVLAAVKEYSPKIGKQLDPLNMSMEQMIRIFCEKSSTETQSSFMNYISNGNSSDQYLTHILNKKT